MGEFHPATPIPAERVGDQRIQNRALGGCLRHHSLGRDFVNAPDTDGKIPEAGQGAKMHDLHPRSLAFDDPEMVFAKRAAGNRAGLVQRAGNAQLTGAGMHIFMRRAFPQQGGLRQLVAIRLENDGDFSEPDPDDVIFMLELVRAEAEAGVEVVGAVVGGNGLMGGEFGDADGDDRLGQFPVGGVGRRILR